MTMRINRRDFLRGAAGASGAALLGRSARSVSAALLPGNQSLASLPPPGESGIEHIVVVMMENRSFDHFLGWLPNADGRQEGLTYLDAAGTAHPTHPLAPDFTGCSHPDPDHSYFGGRVQYDGGAMDGFLRSGTNDEYAIGFYVEEDRPFGSALARNFTTLDRSFCSILGPTFPNRFFLHSAQTDRLSNTTVRLATMPTIWDRLAAADVSALYYFSNLPFLALWGARYIPISRPYLQFLADAAAGTLPAVSFIDPRFTVPPENTGNDDHPPADIRAGDAFLSQTFHAVARGPRWPHTVFIVTYDEWGGFFDHVAPPRATAPNAVDPDLVNGKALLGFRIPTVVASPFSRGEPDDPKVKGMTFDHTSILKLIEWRFGLDPLTARDASDDIENLARALKFRHPDATVPTLPLPEPPLPAPCVSTAAAASRTRSAETASDDPTDSRNPWPGLRDSGLLAGWELPE
jgi:phospholipase C